MKVHLTQIENMSLVAFADSNHQVVMDDAGHSEASTGASPMELMLMGIAGCASMDVISIMKKRRADLQEYTVLAEADRREVHPRIFTDIHLRYILKGKGIKEKDVDRAIRLSEEKYCSAMGMIEDKVNITSSYEIIEA